MFPELARAHIDELRRVAAAHQRSDVGPSSLRRLLKRYIRHS